MAHPIVALIKKNVILKRSSVLGLVLELVLPIALVVLIAVIVKNAGIQLRNASGKHKDTDMFTVLTKVGVQFQSPTSYMPVDWDLSTPEDFFPSARGHGAPIETVADANFKPTDLHEIIAGGLPHVQSAIKFEADNKATFMHLPMVVNAVSPILLAIHGMYKRAAAAAGTGHVNEVDFVIFEFASVSDKRYILLATAYILMLCFTAAVSHLSSSIVQERAWRLREVMKIQGVKDWHIYVSWFITYTAIYLVQAVAVSVTLVLIAFKGFSVILLGCGVFLFTMASAALALTITSVFDSPRTGSIVGISFMIALFLVCVSLECNKPILEQVPAMIVPFYAFKHFMLGASNMARAKKTLANVFEETNYANEHSNPGVALVMLLVDTFIFNLLYLYVEKVIPHEFGQRLPWYFPFNPHYWLGDKKPGLQEVQRDPSNDLVQEPLNSREQQLIAENAVADFKHMTKVFKIDGASLKAVDDVSLTMFPSEILALLGANSAGKTTLTNLLLGLLDMTTGGGSILGLDIEKDQAEIRRLTGFCPQQDVLWPELTVMQHMQFYGSIRGLTAAQTQQETLGNLNDSAFRGKAHTLVKNLSGGMKRKLCTLIAFMGNTKFIILDEPTTGLDPFSRRAVWDLVKRTKGSRIVCLTTHFMQEAELLGNRIAIMAYGRLRAFGTPIFLKQVYACAYHLRIARSAASDERIVSMIESVVPSMEVESSSSTELVTRIPLQENGKLTSLLAAIHDRQNELAIESYTLSGAKLEDVFLQIARSSGASPAVLDLEASFRESHRHSGFVLVLYQIAAIILKRLQLSYRSLMLVFLGFVLPLSMILVGTEAPELIDYRVYSAAHGDVVFDPNKVNIAVAENPRCANGPDLNGMGKAQGITVPHPAPERVEFGQGIHAIVNEIAVRAQSVSDSDVVVGIADCHTDGTHPTAFLLFMNGGRMGRISRLAIITEFMDSIHQYKFDRASVNPKLRRERWGSSDLAKLVYTSIALLAQIFGYTFFGSVVGMLVADERVRGVKFQQLVSGIGPWAYWLGNVLVDLLFFGVIFLVHFVYCQARGIVFLGSLFFISLLTYGAGCITFIYLVSLVTSSSTGCFWLSLSLNFFVTIVGVGCGALSVIECINRSANSETEKHLFAKVMFGLSVLGHAFPAFHFSKANTLLFSIPLLVFLGKAHSIADLNEEIFRTDLKNLVAGVVYFVLVLAVDFIKFNVLTRRRSLREKYQASLDEEAVSILQKPLLEVLDLMKSFGTLKAVQGVSFECSAGEVFALLGTNSAGKSTTVKIAVGELAPDSGSVHIDSMHVHSNLQSVRQKFGYCAQHDALFEDLTVAEHLRFYSLAKGIKDSSNEIESLVSQLGLTAFVNTRAGKLSGGNKRKLSVCIATVGGPAVLFLDEPSSGMDPLSQRFMWGIIKKLSDARRTIVLTTHSMEEAEAVSDRLGIMMQGRFKCIGGLQDIKTTYGKGFELAAQATAPSFADIKKLSEDVAMRTGRDEDSTLTRDECMELCRERSETVARVLDIQYPAAMWEDMTMRVFVEWLAEAEACAKFERFLMEQRLNNENITKVETVGLVQKFLLTHVLNLASIFRCLQEAKAQGLLNEYSLDQFSLERIFNNLAVEDLEFRAVN